MNSGIPSRFFSDWIYRLRRINNDLSPAVDCLTRLGLQFAAYIGGLGFNRSRDSRIYITRCQLEYDAVMIAFSQVCNPVIHRFDFGVLRIILQIPSNHPMTVIYKVEESLFKLQPNSQISSRRIIQQSFIALPTHEACLIWHAWTRLFAVGSIPAHS